MYIYILTSPPPPNSTAHPNTPQSQHLESHGGAGNKDFWAALALVCKDELAKAGGLTSGRDALTSGGVHAAVADELEGMFGGKSVAALEAMGEDIQRRLQGGGKEGLDVDYWENVLAELKVSQSRTPQCPPPHTHSQTPPRPNNNTNNNTKP